MSRIDDELENTLMAARESGDAELEQACLDFKSKKLSRKRFFRYLTKKIDRVDRMVELTNNLVAEQKKWIRALGGKL